MLSSRACQRSFLLAIALGMAVGGGQLCADGTEREPVRPDLTDLTPEQAAASMDRYRQAWNAWTKAQEETEKEARAGAVARALRNRERIDPLSVLPPTPKNGARQEYNLEEDAREQGLTYYEYLSEKRLTDPEWKDLLDSSATPAQPDWLKPLMLPSAPHQ